MSPGDLAVVVPIVSASISFVAAVVAVIVGQSLGRRAQRAADEARWLREDSLRRRTRSEEMAREAMTALTKAAELVGWSAGYARGAATTPADETKRKFVPANLGDVSALCRPVQRAALEIDDETLRTHLEKACDMLPNSDVIRHYGSRHPGRLAWAIQQTTEALISAYLRGVPLPTPLPEPVATHFKVFDQGYTAMVTMWDELEEDFDPDE